MENREANLRALHETLGVCHRHPHVRISTGGGTPMYDGLCGECEMEMEDEAQQARLAAVRPSTCPGCSGSGVLTDDPQVLRCQGCGGIFTDAETPITEAQALTFVALGQPMLANAGPDGSFYFDLDVYVEPRTMVGDYRRIHGWADRQSKRVVQYG